MSDPLRICLIQHSTRSDGMGVGALTAAQVEILEGVARDLDRESRITIMDWKGPGNHFAAESDIDRKLLSSPSDLFAVARRSDVVVDIKTSNGFADIYASPGCSG